jgi:hypothetical protein
MQKINTHVKLIIHVLVFSRCVPTEETAMILLHLTCMDNLSSI